MSFEEIISGSLTLLLWFNQNDTVLAYNVETTVLKLNFMNEKITNSTCAFHITGTVMETCYTMRVFFFVCWEAWDPKLPLGATALQSVTLVYGMEIMV